MTPGERRMLGLRGARSKIERDEDVQRFVEAHIWNMTFLDLRAACIARFGPERAPSLTGLWKHWRKMTDPDRGPA